VRKPRVLLADDNVAVAEALRSFLEGDCELIGVVHDGQALLKTAQDLLPDVIVTDISMPLASGLDVARLLKEQGSGAKIIFITAYEDSYLAEEARRIGASAFLTKISAGEHLIPAIEEVMRGGTVFPIMDPVSGA
jgi:DNA-binding NarL/FixJ family response regulator